MRRPAVAALAAVRLRQPLGNTRTSLLRARWRFQRALLGDNGIDGRVVRRGRDALDKLQLKRAGDACGAFLEEREQAIVVAATVTHAPALRVEGDAGHQHPV